MLKIAHVLVAILVSYSYCSSLSFAEANKDSPQTSVPYKLGTHIVVPIGWSGGCGVDCLYFTLSLLGRHPDYYDLYKNSGARDNDGWLTLDTIKQMLSKEQLKVEAYHFNGDSAVDDLRSMLLSRGPESLAVLHLPEIEGSADRSHLIVVYLNDQRELKVVGGETYQTLTAETWDKRWRGNGLLVSKFPADTNLSSSESFLTCDNRSFDNGRTASSTTFPFSFLVRNSGKATAHLDFLKASCLCTSVSTDKSVIPPGETFTIAGKVFAGTKVGTHVVTIDLRCDRPIPCLVQLAVKWDLAASTLRADPESVTFDVDEDAGLAATIREIKISDLSSTTSHSLVMKGSEPWISAKMSSRPDLVVLSVDKQLIEGQASGYLAVTTEQNTAALFIPVSVSLRKLITMNPSSIWVAKEAQSPALFSLDGSILNKSIDSRSLKLSLIGLDGSVSLETSPSTPQSFKVNLNLDLTKLAHGSIGQLHIDYSRHQLTIPVYRE